MDEQPATETPKEMISGPVALFGLADEMGCDVSIIRDAVRVVGNDEGRVRAWLSGYLKSNNKRKDR